MRVLFVQAQPCVRTLKYAVGLRSRVPGLALGFAYQGRTLSEWYGAGDELFDRWWRLGDDPRPGLRDVLVEFRPDVVHSHNLPDHLTVAALDVAGGAVSVVHDVHDLQSLRHTPYEDGLPEPHDTAVLEKEAVGGCDALVVVSEEMAEAVEARHGLPARTVTFPNYALGRNLPEQLPDPERPLSSPPRVVYQGTLSANGGHYDLRAIFAAVAAGGVTLDLYPARDAPVYQELAAATPGMTCRDMLPADQVVGSLVGYDFGWAGFNASLNAAHLDTALPNKTFEYVAAGVPVLTLGHRALARFVSREGVGASLANLDDLAAQLARLDVVALRRRAAEARWRLTVEANIGAIVALYEEVAAA